MPSTRIIACEPDNSPVLTSGVPQQYEEDGAPAASHPRFRPHPMQGWAPDFIPAVTERAIADEIIDDIRPVSGADALTWSRRLAREEGVFCGVTSGATFAVARQLASEMPEGSRVLAMIPDTGERYMTTPLFGDIEEDMNEAEMTISRSTPSARFDAVPAVAAQANFATGSEKALEHVDAIIADNGQPIAFFALEWCEFCWSAQKLLDMMKVGYRDVHLDGADYADPAWAGEVRTALAQRSGGAPTIPQIFIAGKHLGGATDLFDAFNDGSLPGILERAGIEFILPEFQNAYSLLPKWMQKR